MIIPIQVDKFEDPKNGSHIVREGVSNPKKGDCHGSTQTCGGLMSPGRKPIEKSSSSWSRVLPREFPSSRTIQRVDMQEAD